MAIKKALIVDDSKSARVLLKRMLVDLGLDVDTMNTADDALKYLIDHKPDVIFMDHMMPGMDGFEAVKHIKTNPDTAVIPIMMYTSKGGDVYLSQARALGAVGIISKTISPVGLKDSLFKLGLINDRRIDDRRRVPTDVNDEDVRLEKKLKTAATRHRSDAEVSLDHLHKLMDEQTVELHKSMWLGVESVSHEIFNRLNSEREKQLEMIRQQSESESNKRSKWSAMFIMVIAMLVLSVVFNVKLLSDNFQLEKQIVHKNNVEDPVVNKDGDSNNISRESFGAEIEKKKGSRKALDAFISWAHDLVIEYPYNELALNEKRLPYIEALLKKAQNVKYRGNIILQTHVGRFCLKRMADGGFELADKNLSIEKCEYIGNEVQPGDSPSMHQSLAFANNLSEINALNSHRYIMDVVNVPRTIPIYKYPEMNAEVTAGDWNLAAQHNNLITVKLEPSQVY